ncbi:MAG: hypothetical protein ACJA00_003270, partial [Myxococcota bacterium]
MRWLALTLPLTVLIVGCPPPDVDSDTDLGTDTEQGSDSDTDTDTDTDTEARTDVGVTSRPSPGFCEPWIGDAPSTLSRTGCVTLDDASMPAAGFVPYSIISPLWSDNAEKDRYIAMPEGTTATFDERGDILFPTGTVLGKWFTVEDQLVEIRLYANGTNGWEGASWRWDEETQEGYVETAGAELTLDNGQIWNIPNTGQCRQCHSFAANTTLGLEVSQLDWDWAYPTGVTANQLDTLVHIGFLPEDIPDVPRLVDPLGDAPEEERGRSYLHANCSGCHQPGGGTIYAFDFRYGTDLAASDYCNVDAGNDFGLGDVQRLAPGD